MRFRHGSDPVVGTQPTPFDLPGFTLPLDFKPKKEMDDIVYPNALDTEDIEDGYVGHLFPVRELTMMRIMETITDKPNWEEKVFNEEIAAKWRQEIQDGESVTERMMDYILAELRWKTQEYKNTRILESYDPGVVKSDTAIPRDILQTLQDLARSLEQEGPKDYHPKSDNKVVNLVHPALFPLVFGRTRVLRDKLIGIDDCSLNVGLGEQTTVPDLSGRGYPRHSHNPYSNHFQWLPCEVKFDSNGECQIASYINNLHPAKHRDLYRVIEQVLTRTIPLWNKSLTRERGSTRIPYNEIEYLPTAEPEPELASDESEDDEFTDRHIEWRNSRQPKHPDAPPFSPPFDDTFDSVCDFPDLQARYVDKGLQVIVKLANIELTPENPCYEGGSWHVEGQLNERICSTAIYYYDSENVTENTLSFRHRGDERFFDDFFQYEQGEFQFLRVFGFEPDSGGFGHEPITQNLGGVTCREGRLLTFPNTLQHRVSPFSLADSSRPGHRKILAFFLIDPSRRIISTANVPPQREDWCNEWADAMQKTLGQRLPVELQDMIMSDVDFAPMTMDEAKGYRLELMEERGVKATEANLDFELGGFHLCEH
ncbi:hypothetical protein PHISP_07263 [Aspergillus sp. HF37]|nr:hypothetical protein PHISP_07263 [Aspergillus sp. HF37]